MPGKRALLLTFLLLALLVAALPVLAQEEPAPDPADAAAMAEEPESSIKKFAFSFSAGTYSGATFFELPVQDDRAAVEQGAHTVTLYNGEVMELPDGLTPNRLDAPRKEIESGSFFEGRIGFYLSDAFHIDLTGGLALAEANLSMMQIEDGLPVARITGTEAEGYRDSGVTSFMGGLQLGYDGHALKTLGLTPNFGMGLGGIINRFSVLEDKTALFFQLYGELMRPLSSNLQAKARVTATSYSFQTEEVHYTEQLTTTTLTLGLTWLIDAKPIYAGR
ncbi:MAG TPA: hypothetical protein P5571_02985 [Candidatus Krumholzibacteria bacterium]|nr:hypothetical protein [Candidatus Krumholzibacteria bacterium]HRX50308.1 hypothetical protein [Candidatus Krumholzibacteria bacterium]